MVLLWPMVIFKLKNWSNSVVLEHDLSTGSVGPPLRCCEIMLREWKEGKKIEYISYPFPNLPSLICHV